MRGTSYGRTAGRGGWLGRLFGGRAKGERILPIEVDRIDDNPHQPRSYVLAEPHEDLKMSIAQYGIIVPLIVTRGKGGRYTLVAGQRRLQAARELELKTVPAMVRELNPKQMMEVSYLENLHRESLTEIDLVRMFDRLRKKVPEMEEEELAVAMGLDVGKLRHARALLELPVPVLEALRAGMIDEQRAEALSEISDPDRMCEAVDITYRDRLDLEETCALVDKMMNRPPRFVSASTSVHYHSQGCAYAHLIPEDQRWAIYSKREAKKRGKIACMQCL